MRIWLKRLGLVLVIVVMGFAMTGCGGSGDDQQTEEATETQEITTTQAASQDVVKTKMTGVDENLGPFIELGIDTITLTEDGKLTIKTNGALEEAAGSEVTVLPMQRMCMCCRLAMAVTEAFCSFGMMRRFLHSALPLS